jgi:hypothetical protein
MDTGDRVETARRLRAWARRRPPRWTLSLLTLIVANAAPVAAVLAFRWSVGDLVLLYWTENLILGAVNVLRLALARASSGIGHLGKLFTIPFFAVHYCIFCLVHGLFLVSFFELGHGPNALGMGATGISDLPGALLRAAWADPPAGFHWVMLGLMASHGVSFIQNYLLGGERETATFGELMVQPYRRIVALHVAILLGAFLLRALDAPVALLLILILAKIALDAVLHQREHRRLGRARAR